MLLFYGIHVVTRRPLSPLHLRLLTGLKAPTNELTHSPPPVPVRTHASNVAFPGGAQDPGDADDVHTALREAHEEVGLDPSDVTVVARLPPVFARKNNSVFPVVGFIPSEFRPSANPHEVAVVFSAPLRLFTGDRLTFASMEVLGKTCLFPFVTHVVDGSPLLIWGVTCSVCVAVARAVVGPFKRLRVSLGSRSGEEFSDRTEERDVGDDDEEEDCEDGNVFGDLGALYHMLCKASRPSGRL